jgi:hypothetical protein
MLLQVYFWKYNSHATKLEHLYEQLRSEPHIGTNIYLLWKVKNVDTTLSVTIQHVLNDMGQRKQWHSNSGACILIFTMRAHKHIQKGWGSEAVKVQTF